MQKNRKRSVQSEVCVERSFPVDAPEMVDIDVLSTMSDDDLVVRLRAIDLERDKLSSQGYEPHPWEVEIAYIRREQQIRKVRRDLHDKYMRSLSDDVGAPESSLPYADLDNSSFLGFN